jgi:hypothetical protein
MNRRRFMPGMLAVLAAPVAVMKKRPTDEFIIDQAIKTPEMKSTMWHVTIDGESHWVPVIIP